MVLKFIELLKDWAEKTPIHGVPRIVQPSQILIRIIWVILCLGSFALIVQTVVENFTQYLAFETLNTISIVDVTNLSFPAVTLCNLNPFATLEAIRFVAQNSSINLKSVKSNYITVAAGLSYAKRAELMSSHINDSFRRSMGLDLNSMVSTCYYNGKTCDINSDFTWYYSSEFGNCFTFGSSNSSKVVSRSGKDNGLVVNLFVGLPQSIYTLDFFLGAYVFIHSPNSKPTRDQGLQVPVGFSNSIAIKRVLYQSLGKPYRNCLNSKDTSIVNRTLYEATIAYNGVYNQKICMEYCFQFYILSKCECRDPNIQPVLQLTSVEPCNSLDEIVCSYQGFVDFYETSGKNLECLSMCPEECEIIQYNSLLASSVYSSNFLLSMAQLPKIANLLQQNYNTTQPSEEQVRRSLTTIYLFYDELGYLLYNELPKLSLTDLFSKIGGFIGLLMGASILSVIEIILLSIEIVYYMIFHRCKVKIVDQHDKKMVEKF